MAVLPGVPRRTLVVDLKVTEFVDGDQTEQMHLHSTRDGADYLGTCERVLRAIAGAEDSDETDDGD